MRKLTVKTAPEYTQLKRFYAWVGFLFLALGTPALLIGMLMASHWVAVELANADRLTVYEDGSYLSESGQVGCLYPQYGCTPAND